MSSEPNIRINRPLPRMRIAKDCYHMIHEADPESRVSLTYIRSLANDKEIPVHWTGNRCLINYDALLEYLANPEEADNEPAPQTGVIRRIIER